RRLMFGYLRLSAQHNRLVAIRLPLWRLVEGIAVGNCLIVRCLHMAIVHWVGTSAQQRTEQNYQHSHLKCPPPKRGSWGNPEYFARERMMNLRTTIMGAINCG